ncbi:hypothetical protein BH09BAC1_BH09BAC1_27900 [soil metagenome]
MGIINKWDTGQGGIIEIYQCGEHICGKLVQAKDPAKLDEKNPDASKHNQTLVGTDILRDFKKTDDHTWEDGKIYDPTSGKSYSAKLTLEGDTLKVRGFVGAALFGKTVEWKTVK